MDAQSIYSTNDFMQAEAACEQLRSRGIKCGSVETATSGLGPPYLGNAAGAVHTGHWDVFVAPEDVENAKDVLRAWAGSESPDS